MKGARKLAASTTCNTRTTGGETNGIRANHSIAHRPYFDPSVAANACIAVILSSVDSFPFAQPGKPFLECLRRQPGHRGATSQFGRIVEILSRQSNHILPGDLK